MSDIDRPELKRIIWQEMRADLISLAPNLAESELLLCPTCCRALPFEDFSLEHIIPQQALADDDASVRDAVPKNDRSGLTLLCRRQLAMKETRFPGHGCNSWKGKYYDKYTRELLKPDFLFRKIHSRHQMAMSATAYLGLFREYGYRVALVPSGLLTRMQFFNPNGFLKEMPHNCQMMLAGGTITSYTDDMREYWSRPFKFAFENSAVLVNIRSFSIRLPLSRDPRIPLARSLRYVPPRYRLRPDLSTVFD